MAVPSTLDEQTIKVEVTEIYFIVCDEIVHKPKVSVDIISRAGAPLRDFYHLKDRFGVLDRNYSVKRDLTSLAQNLADEESPANPWWDLFVFETGRPPGQEQVLAHPFPNDPGEPNCLEKAFDGLEDCWLLVDRQTFDQLGPICYRRGIRYGHHYHPGPLATSSDQR